MADPIDKLAQITGMTREQMQEMWDQVQANHKTLGSCDLHDFPDVRPGDRELVCGNCGGTMHVSKVHAYKLGVEHGRRAEIRALMEAADE